MTTQDDQMKKEGADGSLLIIRQRERWKGCYFFFAAATFSSTRFTDEVPGMAA
jgi:hypothetical protein